MNPTASGTELLTHVPERRRVAETLGWQPGIWGAFFLLVASVFGLGGKGPSLPVEWTIFGSSAALGLALTGYEAWRRRNRTVLVKDGERIAVYRKGRLDMILDSGEVAVRDPELFVMLRIGVPLGLAAILFTSVGILPILRNESMIDGLLILSLGLACWASLGSAAWTRFTCRSLRVPIKGSRWRAEETVLIPRSRMKELFPGI